MVKTKMEQIKRMCDIRCKRHIVDHCDFKLTKQEYLECYHQKIKSFHQCMQWCLRQHQTDS